MPEFAQLLGRHRNLVRAAAPQYRDVLGLRLFQRVERMADNVGA
jgi:hypothetical protein